MRKTRIEVEGGLYHVYSRGNNRQLMFRAEDDYREFILQLARQKEKLPFFLYAYCLMPNHFHLLIERRRDNIGRILQRLLTSYSQYHNRKYRMSGHLLQGRYKAILCQSDQYLAELVRYIHLNPVRAKLLRRPEEYPYSGHRAYLGLDQSQLVDVEPVLRYFGATKPLALERYVRFVQAGVKLGRREELYLADHGRLLGSEEWISETLHRIGEIPRGARPHLNTASKLDGEALLAAAAWIKGVRKDELCGSKKDRAAVLTREIIIVVGKEFGASNADLARLLKVDGSSVSRRYEAGIEKLNQSRDARRFARRLRARVRRAICDSGQGQSEAKKRNRKSHA